jgi:hypothetical protein
MAHGTLQELAHSKQLDILLDYLDIGGFLSLSGIVQRSSQ